MKRAALVLAIPAALLALVALGGDSTPSSAAGRPPQAARGTDIHRGVSWVAGPRAVEAADLAPLAEHHVNWIVQTPFGWQERHGSPEVRLAAASERVWWGERDVGLEVTTRLAKAAGVKTLLKPHIWLTRPEADKWRSHIAMQSEADWQRWFESYRAFILHYARLAERLDIEAFAVGTELYRTAVEQPRAWRRLIAEVRDIYSGELTYAANWWREYEEIPFWDALDYIGIQAYFPLAESTQPSVEELVQGWQPHLAAIEALQVRIGKPVLFTEIGFRSTPDAAIEPWVWPRRGGGGEVDLDTQARCYEAFFRTFWHRDWFAGAYIWKWYPQPQRGRSKAADFTPQGKPAAAVLARWYGGRGAPRPLETR